VEGEVLALRRAYAAAGVAPETVGLIEAHGTALPVGDVTEVEALRRVFGERDGGPPRTALGTVKSMIGHLLPASGIAALIKTALALYHKTLPPTLFCDAPNPRLEIEKTPFYLNTETRPWVHGDLTAPRRAGVNAFGFGGINAHAVLEEVPQQPTSLARAWDTELVVLAADSRAELAAAGEELASYLEAHPEAELVDVAATVNARLGDKPSRLAIVAKSPEDLSKKLQHALSRLRDEKVSRIKDRSGIFYFDKPLAAQGKIAFLFPGEGSQYPNMLADLCLAFPEVRACFDLLDSAFASHDRQPLPSQLIFPAPEAGSAGGPDASGDLWDMEYAADAVITADRALFRLLTHLGVQPQVILGHSSGELMALEAAGAFELSGEDEIREHIAAANRLIVAFATAAIPEGRLVAVGAGDRAALE
jgi:acyl transferase domain-containing protein